MIKAPAASTSETKGLFSSHKVVFTIYDVCDILHPTAQANCIAVIDPLLGEFCHLSPAAIVNTPEPAMTDSTADNAGGIRQPILQSLQREQSASSKS